MSKQKRPWIAVLLSLILPGLGQLYAGSILGAVLWMISWYILMAAGFAMLLFVGVGFYLTIVLILTIPVFYILVCYSAIRRCGQPESKLIESLSHKWLLYPILILFSIMLDISVVPYYSSYEAYKIPAVSMKNCLYVGDYLLADLNAYEDKSPEIDDVVIFIWPRDGETKYIKRCVGLPGDTIEIVDKQLYRNGLIVPPGPTIKFIDTLKSGKQIFIENSPRDNFGPYVVPDNSYFMMGDNRDNSYDSRFWGPVAKEYIIAKPLVIHWSSDFDRIGKFIK